MVPACECQVSLAALAPQLRLEVQYVLQCRRDERLTRTPVTTVTRMVRLLAGLPVTSLLDWDEETFRTSFGRPAPKDTGPRALIIYGLRRLEDLAEDHGWETEYRRDVWRLRRLGRATGDGSPSRLRFGAIPQPWLNDLASYCTSCGGWRVRGLAGRSGCRGAGGFSVAGGSDIFPWCAGAPGFAVGVAAA